MAITGLCATTDYANLGSLCKSGNTLKMASSLFLTTQDFEMTKEDFADFEKWEEAVKARLVFPIHNIFNVEDQSEEATFYEAASGTKVKTKDPKYVYSYEFFLNLGTHKKFQSFAGSSLSYFIVDSGNTVRGYETADGKVKGYKLETFEPSILTAPTADTPALSKVMVTEANQSELNLNGLYMKPSWSLTDLNALTDVDLTIVGTPTATEIIAKVGNETAELSADGSVEEIAILGILTADFEVKTTAGATQTVTFTDNGDGTYTGVGTGLETGTVDLKSPATMVSEGLMIMSTGAVDVTI